MPYECGDHLRNPWGLTLIVTAGMTIYAVTRLSSAEFAKSLMPQAAAVPALLAAAVGIALCYFLKLQAVGHCLDVCIQTYHRAVIQHTPDVVLGYSWGGGIACGLLNRRLWTGVVIKTRRGKRMHT